MKKIIILFSALLAMSSCQREINIKLKSSDIKTVIEANYSSISDSINVSVCKSSSYFGTDTGKTIDNAVISLKIGDTTIVLQNNSKGIYSAKLSPENRNKTYKIEVQSEGKLYEATSSMPALVKIDSIRIKKAEGMMAMSHGPNDKGDSSTVFVVSTYMKDPVGHNYYRILLYNNDKLIVDNNGQSEAIFDDQFYQANKTIEIALTAKCYGNERIRVELMSVDKATYDYFTSLWTTMQSAGGSFSVPENPRTNFNNDALGYFSAYSADTVSAIVPIVPKK